MDKVFCFVTILIFCFQGFSADAQTVDSARQVNKQVQTNTSTIEINQSDFEGTDDFAPGLLFGVIILLAFTLIFIGVGIALAVLGLLIVFGFVSMGILSTSIIVGLHKKSLAKGFKTFTVLASTFAGILSFSIGFWALNKIFHWATSQIAITTGAISGLLAGILFGLIVFYLLKRLTSFFKSKLSLVQSSQK